MAKSIRLALAELSLVAAKLCAHSPASNDLASTDQEYADAGRVLLLQLALSVDAVCKAVAFEAGLDEPFDYQPFYESLDGNLLYLLEQRADEKVHADWW